MKKSAILILLLSSILFFSKKANAQDYKAAAGLKFSYEFGPAGKYFINETDALELQIGLRSHGAALTGLWERHIGFQEIEKFKLYFGFGAHLGGVGDHANPRYNQTLLLGADGVVGVEWVIPNSPIALSGDLNPRLELGRGPYFDLSPGIGIKYIFK
ncbi:hypothetical protein [Mucilaginibacter myungsuensis]|uniref:DUF3575 domain-containing protein n=2 Tax=Mucilaginibacter myungsuensis TaxID=649104 RepID=A0A929KYR9_9SPHI|nr:hypothetical protein [Mucilaginibacter myungsuensis]MBE9664164.1 hypothetical protein [Mucilaginibacter myungsuensis]MDN3599867.1 hypothetical protein [Mucilaginibacter myungsuensis]